MRSRREVIQQEYSSKIELSWTSECDQNVMDSIIHAMHELCAVLCVFLDVSQDDESTSQKLQDVFVANWVCRGVSKHGMLKTGGFPCWKRSFGMV